MREEGEQADESRMLYSMISFLSIISFYAIDKPILKSIRDFKPIKQKRLDRIATG